VFIADASSGAVIAECPTKFQPTRLLVLDNILITANWEARARRDGDWLWQPKPSANAGGGTLDAFDAATGKALWSAQVLAFKILAADGVVYVQTQPAEAKTPGEIVALELKSGKERWRVSAEKLGNPAAMHLGSAGPGFATVFKSKELLTTVLSAADGSVRFEVPGKSDWTPLVNGFLWIANKRYDPLTGTKKGEAGTWLGGNACRQQALTPCFVISNYGMRGYSNPDQKPAAKPESSGLQGTRSACIIGWLPANGMIYSAQTACKCRPGAAYGFVGLGSGDSPPAAADFEQPRLVEKGPAFGTLAEAAPVDTADWPVFRHDALRSASTTARIPQDLKELWRTPVTKPGEDVLTGAWRSLLLSCVSAPVIQGGNVFVSTSDQGQVVALDASTGKPVWTATLGSRLNGPPALYRGLCVIGCNDGWVYALSTRDGRPVWRTRIAPQERRIVAFGRVESVWPAAGPVLIHEDTIFATAGRSSESEGGVALAALNPATGAVLWAKEIGPGPQRMNDALAVRDGLVAWQYLSFDPKKGDRVAPEKFPNDKDYDGGIARLQGSMIEPMWTVIKHRRAGNAYKLGGLFASQLAWNEKLAVGTGGGILREKLQGDAAPKPADFAWTFSHKPREQQIEALVLSADTVLCAGRNLNAKGGKPSGFFWIVSATDGKKTAEFPLECPPACDGIAVAGERVYLTLLNGQVLCFGK
jgi:outer membrane protein assembly factor BamB